MPCQSAGKPTYAKALPKAGKIVERLK